MSADVCRRHPWWFLGILFTAFFGSVRLLTLYGESRGWAPDPVAAAPFVPQPPVSVWVPPPGQSAIGTVLVAMFSLGMVLFAGCLIISLYFAPTIVAFTRGHPNRVPIMIINILAGWTLVGGVVALAWAFMDFPVPSGPATVRVTERS